MCVAGRHEEDLRVEWGLSRVHFARTEVFMSLLTPKGRLLLAQCVVDDGGRCAGQQNGSTSR